MFPKLYLIFKYFKIRIPLLKKKKTLGKHSGKIELTVKSDATTMISYADTY